MTTFQESSASRRSKRKRRTGSGSRAIFVGTGERHQNQVIVPAWKVE